MGFHGSAENDVLFSLQNLECVLTHVYAVPFLDLSQRYNVFICYSIGAFIIARISARGQVACACEGWEWLPVMSFFCLDSNSMELPSEHSFRVA